MTYDTPLYPLLGSLSVVPEADLTNLVSPANRKGDVRVGGDSLGKRPGMEIFVKATADSTLKKAFALGSKSSDAWRVVDGSANFTPVNLSTWTASAGCTYAAGLLTADGTDNPTASQVVALKAGKYRLRAFGAGEGTYATDYHTPKLTVTGATDGALVTKTWNKASDVTVSAAAGAETATPTALDVVFEVTVNQNVTFAVSVVNEAGALEAGSGFISLELLEAA